MTLLALIRLTSSGWYWAALALVSALVGIVFYYRRTVPPLRRPVKLPLIALRTIAAVALFLALADALWAAIKTQRQLHDLIVLTDHSASMKELDDLKDGRYDRAGSYADRILSSMKERAAIHRYTFAESLRTEPALPDSFGMSTDLGDALLDLSRKLRELNPRAVVVLSDGANNRGTDPAEAVSRLGIPVVTVGFGKTAGTEARVVEAIAPEVALTGKSFEITGALQGGAGDQKATLRLTSHGRTLLQQPADLGSGGARTPFTMSTVVDSPGVHDFRIDVVGADGRANPAAGRSLFVRVLKGRIKVMLFAGELDWEFSYLKRFLERQSRIELIPIILSKPTIGHAMPTASDWNDADVVVFMHLSRQQLETVWSPHAAQFSAPGHGVAFILNKRFTEGAPRSTAYPFEFLKGNPVTLSGEFPLRPQSTRQNHPIIRLDPASDWAKTSTLWSDRPPWTDMVCIGGLPANADVLVRSGRSVSGEECPAIWTRISRGGKSLVVSGGPFWRWAADRAGSGMPAREYEAFWSNAIHWLSLRDETDRLAVRSDQQVYHVGEPIILSGSVYDEVYRFMDRAEVTAHVWSDSAAHESLSVFLPPGSGDRFEGRVTHLAPGTYHYNGQAKVDSTVMPLTGGVFRVEPYGLEQQATGLNETGLRAVARQSGGRYYSENEPPAVLDSLDWTASIRQTVHEVPLWNQSLLLGIFIATLLAEWFVRRRKQLL